MYSYYFKLGIGVLTNVFFILELILSSDKMNGEADNSLLLIMKGDSWFGSVKAAANLAARGMHGIFNVKQCHALFPKTFIAEALKDALGGVSIVLKGKHHNGHTLFALGY